MEAFIQSLMADFPPAHSKSRPLNHLRTLKTIVNRQLRLHVHGKFIKPLRQYPLSFYYPSICRVGDYGVSGSVV